MAMANQGGQVEELRRQVESLAIALPTGIKSIDGKWESTELKLKANRIEIDEYLRSEDNNVLFLGEGNYTFSAAVASFRGTWNNIEPSELNLTSNAKDYNKLFRRMIAKMEAHTGTSDSDFRGYVGALAGLKDEHWEPRKVNAEKLNETWVGLSKPNALFFQCPWEYNVDTLISNFFESAKDFQENDDLLFLGICTEQPYVGRYKLGVEYESYELIGVDDLFCKKMFARGYEHQPGYRPEGYPATLTPDQLNSIVTLCYRKRAPITTTPSIQASDVNSASTVNTE